jgi:Domain of unknown function (DUF4178)
MTSSLAIGTVILVALVLATAAWYVLSYRKAHLMTPVTVLRPRSRARSRSIFEPLSIGDAVSHAGADYVVEDISSSFADGETSRMVHLVPRDGLARDQWLSISPGGTELALLDAAPTSGDPGARQLALGAMVLPLVSAQTAVIKVRASDGSAPARFASVWRYRAGPMVATVEQSSDGHLRAYAGRIIDRGMMDVWPAASTLQAA